MKILFRILLIAVVLVVIAVAGLYFFVKSSGFKPTLEQQLTSLSGRDVKIHGDVSLSFYPWLGLKADGVSVAAPDGFSSKKFVDADILKVKVRLMPLFSSQVEVDKVYLDGLKLHLETNKAGKANWEFGSETEPTATEEASSSNSLDNIVLAGIQVKNAHITYQTPEITRTISNLDLLTGEVKTATHIPVSFSLDYADPDQKVGLNGTLHVMADLSSQKYSLRKVDATIKSSEYGEYRLMTDSALDVSQERMFVKSFSLVGDAINVSGTVDLNGFATPNATAKLRLLKLNANQFLNGSKGNYLSAIDGTLDVALANNVVDVNELLLRFSDAVVKGKSRVQLGGEKLAATANLDVKNLNLRGLLSALDIALDTKNPEVLKKLDSSMDLSLKDDNVIMQNIKAKLDNTTVNGSAGANIAASIPAVRFDLALDRIVLDDYLSASESTESSPSAELVPVESLRSVYLDGVLKVSDRVEFGGLALTQPQIKLTIKKGVLSLTPFQGGAFSGKAKTMGTLNVADTTPAFNFEANSENININQLLEYLIGKGYMGGKVWLEGTANTNAHLTAKGNDIDALMRTLNGPAEVDVQNGKILGVNLLHELMRANALLSGKTLSSDNVAKETPIKRLKIVSKVVEGVVNSSSIIAETDVFKIDGKGIANLVSQELNFDLNLEVIHKDKLADPTLANIAGYKIPFVIKGSFMEPKVRVKPDVLKAKLTQAIKERKEFQKAQAEAEKRIAEEKRKLEEKRLELEKRKEEARKKFQDKLKGKTKKQQDKLKNKLKGLF
jgi:AsmA protein